jgi:hypothetical protein
LVASGVTSLGVKPVPPSVINITLRTEGENAGEEERKR